MTTPTLSAPAGPPPRCLPGFPRPGPAAGRAAGGQRPEAGDGRSWDYVLGHSLEFFSDSLGIARRRHAEFGPVAWANVVGTRLVMVLGIRCLETVLVNRDQAFSSREGWDYFIGPCFDRGLMLMDFEEHK